MMNEKVKTWYCNHKKADY